RGTASNVFDMIRPTSFIVRGCRPGCRRWGAHHGRRGRWRARRGDGGMKVPMATTSLRGAPVRTTGSLPAAGSAAPDLVLTTHALGDLTRAQLRGRRVVLNALRGFDTGVCASSVRTFIELAADLARTVVVCVSEALPCAQGRFCGAEGIENV